MTQQTEKIIPIQDIEEHPRIDDNQKILDDIGSKAVNFIHGVIDFTTHLFILGFYILIKADGSDEYDTETIHLVKENGVYKIKKSDTGVKTQDSECEYLFKEPSILPNLEEKWGLKNLKQFLSSPTYPLDLLDWVSSALKKYIDLQQPVLYRLLALWCISTYFAYLFPIFPFIFVFGLKGTGKSKLLELMSYIVFNGQKIVNATEAALCDAMDGMRCTVFFDQSEKMPRRFIGLLADSYKKSGAKRWIIERRDGERKVREFSGYGPKCFAGTKLPDNDLADRGPIIQTFQTDKALPDLIGNDERFKELRNGCYKFLLTSSEQAQTIYQSLPSDGTRKCELWRPLEGVARALNVPETEVKEIKDIFNSTYGKSVDRPSEMELVLFHALNDFMSDQDETGETVERTPKEILDEMQKLVEGKEPLPSRQWIGKKLVKYSLVEKEGKKKKTRDKLMHYVFDKANVKGIIHRYIEIEENHQ